MTAYDVCIAVPVFGESPYLADALLSMRGLRSNCLIIVQQGDLLPHAGARAIAAEMESIFWTCEPDSGQADAINRAWSMFPDKSFRFYTWVNADDMLLPLEFDRMVRSATAAPGAAIHYGDYNIIGASGSLKKKVNTPRAISRRSLIWSRNQVPGVATLIDARIIQSIGLLRTSMNWCMDLEYWIRASRQYPLTRSASVVMAWRMHDGSKTVSLAAGAREEALSVRGESSRVFAVAPVVIRRVFDTGYRLRFRVECWRRELKRSSRK